MLECCSGGGLGRANDGPVHTGGGFVGEDHLGVDEPGRDQPVEVLLPAKGTGDAPNVGTPLGAVGRGEVVLSDDIGDPPGPTPGTSR
jgi:hypothetical protein